MSNSGKNAKAAQVTNMITGVKKQYPNGSQVLTYGGTTQTVDQVTGAMQAFVNNRAAVTTAQATVKVKVAAEKAQAPSLLATIDGFVEFVRTTFGNSADVLGGMDIPPLKERVPMTAEAKAVAAAKRVATREARGTTSKKAKKNVKGNVTAALVVTPATPSAPAAPVAPAAPTGGTPPAHS